MNLLRMAISRTGFLAIGFLLAIGAGSVFAAWTPSPKNPLDPLYSTDWNNVTYNTSAWERKGTIFSPEQDVFLNTSGSVGIGNTFLSGDLQLDVEGKIGATEYCDQNGLNCVPAASIATGGGGGTVTGIIDGGGLEIQNGTIGLIKFPCAENDVMKFQNGNWQCSADVVGTGGATQTIHDVTCNTNEVLKYGTVGWNCAVDESGGGSGYWSSATGGISYTGGDVGIGTTNPSAELEIYTTDGIAAIRLVDDNGSAQSDWEMQSSVVGTDERYSIFNVGTNKSYFEILKDGAISLAPTTSLDIDGDINISNGSDICVIGGSCLSQANTSPTITDMTCATNQVLKYSSGSWNCATDETGTGGTGTDDQVLSLTGNMLSIESGNSVSLATFSSKFVDGTSTTYAVYTGGNVGIGTSSPSSELEVNGNIVADAYLYGSDLRLKNNIQTTNGLDTILALRGVDFEWIKNGEKSLGFIAQEVEGVLPEIVQTDDEGYKSVNYAAITASLVEAVKEQQKQIEKLEKRIIELEK